MKNVNFDSYTDILLKTRERLTDPKNWCGDNPRGRNSDGGVCLGRTIVTLCGIIGISGREYGSFIKEMFAGLMPTYKDCGGSFIEIADYPNIPHWNDTHTHAEVLELLDTAIAQRMQIAA